jgi:hypothetical protein
LTVTGSVSGWTQAAADLIGLADEQMHLRLRLEGSGVSWFIDDVALYDAPPAYMLPFGDDMEIEGNWWAAGAWAAVTSTAHSGVTSWRGHGDDAALILSHRLDLSGTLTPTLSLWQRFDLPQDSVGQVKVTLDGGLEWQPVLTVTGTITTWTPLTVDLSAYAGQEIGLDFYLTVPLTATVGPEQGWFIDDVLVEE